MPSKKKQGFAPTFRGYPAKELDARVRAIGLAPTSKNRNFFLYLSEIAHVHPSMVEVITRKFINMDKVIAEHRKLIKPFSTNNNFAKNLLTLFNVAKAEIKAKGAVSKETHQKLTEMSQYLKSPNDKLLMVVKEQFAIALRKFEESK
jgi:hypothetical protein